MSEMLSPGDLVRIVDAVFMDEFTGLVGIYIKRKIPKDMKVLPNNPMFTVYLPQTTVKYHDFFHHEIVKL